MNKLLLLPVLAGISVAPLLGADVNLGTWKYSEKSAEAATVSGESVTIPHTWNATDIQAGTGKNTMSKDGYRRAPSWYSLTLPATTPGKRVFVRFDGVSSVADVSLDGVKLREHKGVGTAFEFELTEGLKKPGPHTLTVMADNTWRADVGPLSGDFGLPGGIYRPVHLIETDAVCFASVLGDFGAKLTQLKATKESGEVEIAAHLDNAGASAVEAGVVFSLKDAAGKTVATKTVKKSVAPGGSELVESLSLSSPTLWNGVTNPYLYTVEVSLKSGDSVADTVSLPFGFRTFHADPKLGFFLNGKSYPLRGVNRHQDREGQSWAITDAQNREDAAMIAEIGANVVRCAHYPHSQVFLNECDRLGIMVWSEEPVIDTTGPEPKAFTAVAEVQLREMIAQQRHHASIFAWSLFNEIGQRDGGGKDHLTVLRRLNEIAHEADPTRPTVAATNKSGDKALSSIADMMALNSYPGWYGGGSGDLSGSVAAFRKSVPTKAWGVSEYGAGASLSQQDDAIAKGPDPKGKWHPEAWQARVHEHALASIQKHPELWGTFVWNMFDFASPWRSEGERNGMNDKGLVTYDRKTRKDAFYVYQANWSKSPVLHLLARRDDRRTDADTVIRYYSNLAGVTVTLNGAVAGKVEVYGPNAYIIKGVKLRPGANTVEASAKTKAGAPVTDKVEWTLAETAAAK